MELNVLENATLDAALETAHTQINASSLLEIVCALAIPLLALLIGIKINRYIDSKPHTTLGLKIIDFTAPLLSSTLAIGFSLLTLTAFHTLDMPVYVMPFVLKLTIAWFAVQLVYLMSSRQSAGWVIVCFVVPVTLLHLFDVWDIAIALLKSLSFSLGSVELNAFLIVKGITAIFVLQWLASFAVRVTDNRLKRLRYMRASNRTLIVKIFQILLYCFVFIFGMQMLGINLTALSVFGGALGVGLGFGLQKIASNFISGIILLFEKSIEVNDLIELADGTTGFIRQTFARYTLMETQEGKEILIPNEEFISQRVITWTHSDTFARGEILVTISYDSDVALASKLMLEAANTHPKRSKARSALCVLNTFRDHGVEMLLYFWVADIKDGRAEPKSDIMLAILKAFKANNIIIPYPQREVRVRAGESIENAAVLA